MATTRIKFRDKAFWIPAGVAGVWFAMCSQVRSEDDDAAEMFSALKSDVDMMISPDWPQGLGVIFQGHLQRPELLSAFQPVLVATNERLTLAASGEMIHVQNQYCRTQWLLPQLPMFYNVLYQPEKVPMPAHSWSPERGWHQIERSGD